ncbi:biotin/lipoate A/B protein ligase, partial [Striga asiatica]
MGIKAKNGIEMVSRSVISPLNVLEDVHDFKGEFLNQSQHKRSETELLFTDLALYRQRSGQFTRWCSDMKGNFICRTAPNNYISLHREARRDSDGGTTMMGPWSIGWRVLV